MVRSILSTLPEWNALLQTNKAGEGNWNFDSSQTSNLGPAIASQSVDSATSAQTDSLCIQNINVADARIQYHAYGSSPKLFQASSCPYLAEVIKTVFRSKSSMKIIS